jgi:GTP-binding protein LepA
MLVRVKEGTATRGQQVYLMHTRKTYEVEEVGYLKLERVAAKDLEAGEVGYVIAGVKSVRDITVGDTLTDARRRTDTPLPGYRPAKPVVFASLYPIASDEYQDLTVALEKLALNDAALIYEKDSSAALGFGFRCGFLGLLHLEVVQQRLEREYDLALLLSAPTVKYRVKMKDGEEKSVDNPVFFPDPSEIESTWEPYIKATIWMPERYVGPIMELCRDRRAEDVKLHYLTQSRIELTAEMPLSEVLFDFYDRLKSMTQGYGSFDYEIRDYRETDVVKVDILVNGESVDALSQLTHAERSRQRALHYCERLAETIPRQQFKIAIQGVIGGKVIARTTINAYRKDVTAKCYGGDITRKRKLLEKQREGKKKMKMVGAVEIPQSAFIAVLRSDAGK